jgi:hypothetical protein
MKRTARTTWRAARRKRERERLSRSLEELKYFCAEPDEPRTIGERKYFAFWPSDSFIMSLQKSVMCLIASDRINRPWPIWKAFMLLDTRMPSLRLVLRVNNLVKRAAEKLAQAGGESVLSKAAREARAGVSEAQNLLRNIALQKQSLTDLLQDHDAHTKLWSDAWPLVNWLIFIGHPDVENLVKPHRAAVSVAVDHRRMLQERKEKLRRELTRERVRRHRAKNSLPEKRYTTPL